LRSLIKHRLGGKVVQIALAIVRTAETGTLRAPFPAREPAGFKRDPSELAGFACLSNASPSAPSPFNA